MENKVLLVDDDAFLREILNEFLQDEGIHVVCASDGKEALDLVDETYSCVVTDMAMPKLDGVSLVQKLKADYPALKIIAISGGRVHSGDLYLKLAAKAGADRTFCKPFDLEEFLACLTSEKKALSV